MAKTAAKVLEEIPRLCMREIGVDRTVAIVDGLSLKEFIYFFEMAGYGPNKALRRVRALVDSGILQQTEIGGYTCIWWTGNNHAEMFKKYHPIREIPTQDFHGVTTQKVGKV